MCKMWPLNLAILIIALITSSVLSVKLSDDEVNNLLAVGINDESRLPFLEYYNAKNDNWHSLRTTNINITDYGVAIYRNRLFLIGGRHESGRYFTNTVNEVDLLSGEIKMVNYLNEPRSNPSVAVVGEGKSSALYIMGGTFSSGAVTATVEKWDESAQKWSNVKPMVAPSEGGAVVVHNGDIYVFGGFNGDRYIDTVQVYSSANDMWSVKKPMDIVRAHFHGVSDGRYIFIVGGFTDHSNPNSALNRVDRYDPVTDIWIPIANISRCSGNVGVNLLDDQLYAVGGSYCVRTQIYHKNNNTWQFLAPLTYGRSSQTILKVPFELKDYEFNWTSGNRSMKDILVFGYSSTDVSRKFDVYHPEDDYWQIVNYERTYTAEYHGAFVNDRLIIAGGRTNGTTSPTNKVFEISMETGKLQQLSSMNVPRYYASYVTVGEGKSARLYSIGGYDGFIHQNSVERWNPFNDSWEFVSSMNVGRSRGAAVQHEGDIYFFGGSYSAGALNYSEVYLVDEDRWEFRAPMLHKTEYCSAVSDGRYVYVVGGRDGQDLSYVQRYDPSTDAWKLLANTTSSVKMGISLLDNAPIVFGGYIGNLTDIVEIYDGVRDEWRKLAPMNYERAILSALQIPWKWKYSTSYFKSKKAI